MTVTYNGNLYRGGNIETNLVLFVVKGPCETF